MLRSLFFIGLLAKVASAQSQRETSLTPDDYIRAEKDARRIQKETEEGLVDPVGGNSDDARFTEGDMLDLEKPQGCAGGATCNGIRDIRRHWPSGQVPYTVSADFNSNERATIAAAISEFNRQVGCVHWVPRTSQRDYVFIKADAGCFSQVGRTGGRQDLSLGRNPGNTCVTKGITLHEMMHATGFYHEQSRDDRDNHIRINHGNIIPQYLGNFEKYGLNSITHLGTSYDYGSLMHYGRDAFSRNRQPTIEIPNEPGVEIGQRRGLSPTDILKLKRMYGCDGGGPVVRPVAPRVVRPVTPRVLRPVTPRVVRPAPPPPPPPEPVSRESCRRGSVRGGPMPYLYQTEPITSVNKCRQWCHETSGCQIFSFSASQSKCWLFRSASGYNVYNTGFVSGPKSCGM